MNPAKQSLKHLLIAKQSLKDAGQLEDKEETLFDVLIERVQNKLPSEAQVMICSPILEGVMMANELAENEN